jgi:cytochrome c oxidase subunit 3
MSQTHWSQLVTPSPWPFVTANSLLFVTSGLIFWFQYLAHISILLKDLFININNYDLGSRYYREATHLFNILSCANRLKIWIGLFIISEAFFFLGFFWAFFHVH